MSISTLMFKKYLALESLACAVGQAVLVGFLASVSRVFRLR